MMGFVGLSVYRDCRPHCLARRSTCRHHGRVRMVLGGYRTQLELNEGVNGDTGSPKGFREFSLETGLMSQKASEARKKLYVIDTNVVLHSCQCLFSFGDNDVSVPITVLEELDKFKKGNEELNYNAREFLRTVDEIAGRDHDGALAGEGISLGDQCGKMTVCLSCRDEELESFFFQDAPDHRILASLKKLTALEQEKTIGRRDVILVTKDNNLRIKAKSFDLLAQDYVTDTVASVENLYSGRKIVENVSTYAINQFFENNGGNRLRMESLGEATGLTQPPLPNESYVLRNCTRSVLASWKHDPMNAEFSFKRVEKKSVFNIVPRNSEQTFALNLLLDIDVRLVTISGKAGTGKTLLALAAALESRKQYSQIYLSRPVIPLSNRDSGYLPGDIKSKLDPYMQPLWDNVGVIKAANMCEQTNGNIAPNSLVGEMDSMVESGFLKVAPLAYIRGRSFHGAYFIVDEAQNLTPHEVKTIITRAGEGTKIVLTGDIHQIDNPYVDSRSNGLSYIIERMKGQALFGHVTLEKGERSELADLASRLL